MSVLIITGSTSDGEIAIKTKKVLDEFKIPSIIKSISAHRIPEILINYLNQIDNMNVKVIIAMAGMSAALPGVVAAHVDIPVIGVPLSDKNGSTVNELASLLATLQMPPGVPVLTVSVDGYKNAAIATARIFALSDRGVHLKLERYKRQMKDETISKIDYIQNSM